MFIVARFAAATIQAMFQAAMVSDQDTGGDTMIEVGSEPFYECSTKGDKRFSPFYAFVNGRSIENQFQAAKVFSDGTTGLSWREAKGRRPVNPEELATLYDRLWRQYLIEHPYLMDVLVKQKGLSDIFGQPGHMCQATTLWALRQEYFEEGELEDIDSPMYGYWLHHESECGGVIRSWRDFKKLTTSDPLVEMVSFKRYAEAYSDGWEVEWTENEEL